MEVTKDRNKEQDNQFDAARFLKSAPTDPGVYLMYDREGRVIYVGKAKNLKNRLHSYFKGGQLPPKTAALVANIAAIETTITATENEALLLESNLIKKHRPRYNVRLVDDKSYPYIYVSDHPYPQFSFYRGRRKRRGTLLGPYPSSGAVREILALLKRVFKVRQCDDTFFSHRTRPCLQYQIDRCSAPCVNKITKEAYHHDVSSALLFLKGESQELLTLLGQKMTFYSKELAFEKAAVIRDQIQQIHEIQGQNAIEGGRDESLDLMALATLSGVTAIEVMMVRDGRVLGTRAYFPTIPKDTPESEIMGGFLLQYYGANRRPPQNIVLNIPLEEEEHQWLESGLSELSGRKVVVQSNVRQQKRRWLEMVGRNALQSVKVKLAGKSTITHRLEALRAHLRYPRPIERIDSFDISHSFGERTVAANIVYTPEGFLKQQYRRFNIEGVTKGDDYGALEQALTRRFQGREEARYPNILLIDGGKGQFQVARKVLQKLQIPEGRNEGEILLVGFSQGEGKRQGMDRLWVGEREADPLASTSPAFHLLAQIRDEAHRFAIEGHRTQRDKLRRRSLLEDIPGIGPKRRQALLAHFGGLAMIRKATIEDIAKVEGISHHLAGEIYRALNRERES